MKEEYEGNKEYAEYCDQLRNDKSIKWDIDSLCDKVYNEGDTEDSFLYLDALLEVAKEKGVDLNAYREDGDTLLTLACHNEHSSLIICLCTTEGVDINKCNRDGKHPIQCCVWYGHIKTLMKYGATNPYKVPEKPVPVTANFSGISTIALASMLANYVEIDHFAVRDSAYDSAVFYLKAYSVILWYKRKMEETNTPFSFDALIWLYYHSDIKFLYDYGDTETMEEVKNTQNYFEEVLNEDRAKGFLVEYLKKEDIEPLQNYSFEDGFRVSSYTTHWFDLKTKKSVILDKWIALSIPNGGNIPECPLDDFLFRKAWD